MSKTIQAGEIALIYSHDHKRFLQQIKPGDKLQTHRGEIFHDDLIGQPWGSQVRSHLGTRFTVHQPSIRDVLLEMKRSSQIIYPKDIGYILLRLNAGPGKIIAEAGTGSGALTTALAWAVGPTGKVISYDRRDDMQTLARRNLERVGLADRVDFRLKDVEEGFDPDPIDALFLDLPDAHHYIEQVRAVLPPGGNLGAILPTTNQVSAMLQTLGAFHFSQTDVCELLLRFYKTVPARIRPQDRMVAHTGYLLFSRPMAAPPETEDNSELT